MGGIIIGTAGHVDHGKTALIRALTGIDTDRLQEEKDRGLSIDLGFAPLDLPSGIRAGVVDVPGHERFMANMLAGVSGMDMVILVIDLTEGIMPQTREHLEVVELLQIKRGVLVLSKADLVEEEWIELMEQEVREELAETIFARAPLVVVSTKKERGIEELRNLLDRLIQEVEEKKIQGPPRLPVDRSFHRPGMGTVITGTLVKGLLKTGQEVEIMPGGEKVKIRQIQVHGETVSQAVAGQRVALNLPVERDSIRRGDLIAAPGHFFPTHTLDAEIRLLEHFPHPLKDGSRVHFHLGTLKTLARVRVYEGKKLDPGQEGLARLELEEPAVTEFKDPFIIRFFSPVRVMGGGVVLVNDPPIFARRNHEYKEILKRCGKGSQADYLYMAIYLDRIIGRQELQKKAGLEVEKLNTQLDKLQDEVIELPGQYLILTRTYNLLQEEFLNKLAEYHGHYNLRPGMPKSSAGRILSLKEQEKIDALLSAWEKEKRIRIEGNIISLPEHEPVLTSRDEELTEGLMRELKKGKFAPPLAHELQESLGREVSEVLGYLVEKGKLIKISEDFYLPRENYEEAREKLKEHMDKKQEITVAEYRDILETSRKYALPLLVYFDDQKITQRRGDLRVPGPAYD